MFDGFVCGGAVYGKFVGMRDDLSPIYEKYTLSDVVVREKFECAQSGVGNSEAVLYFISGRSYCKNELGIQCPLPMPRADDVVFMNFGTDSERVYKLAEAGYFIGLGDVEYTRLKLV